MRELNLKQLVQEGYSRKDIIDALKLDPPLGETIALVHTKMQLIICVQLSLQL